MLEHGALSIAAIQDIAAASIQAVYKGYTVRKAFRKRKQLLMRHEQLRKDVAKKREEEQRRREAVQQILVEAADKRRVSLVRAEQEKLTLTDVDGLTANNPKVEKKKSSKGERKKTKEERHRVQRSRFPRSSTTNQHEVLESLTSSFNMSSEASLTTRLKELLSPTSCRAPPKPTPPTGLKVRENSNASTPSTPVFTVDQTSSRECIPLKKKEVRASALKHRNHKELTSEKAAVRDQTASLRSSSSLDGTRPSRKAPSGSHTPTSTSRRREREQLRRRIEAARIIQRAWRRFCACRRRDVKACEGTESSELNYAPNWKKMENRGQVGKAAQSKSSLLQSIYGNSVVRRGRLFQSHLDIPLQTQSQLSGLDCVHLPDTLNQAKQFSYHLRPQSAGQGTRGRGKH